MMHDMRDLQCLNAGITPGCYIWDARLKEEALHAHVQQLSVAEMRMLRWICGYTRMDRVRNDDIRDRLELAPIEEKLVQYR